MSSFEYAAYDTYDTVEGVVSDVFEHQDEKSLVVEKPRPEVSAEDLLKKKYKVDAIPEEDFDRLMAEVQKIQADEGLTTHPLRALRKMWEEEQGTEDDEPKEETRDEDVKEEPKDCTKDCTKDEKTSKGWFPSLW